MGMFVLRVAMLISIASVTALSAHAAHAQSGPIFDPAPEEVYALGSDSAKDIALADVDGDGDLDALIANGDIFSAYDHVLGINDGQGNFSLRAAALGAGMGQAIAVADLDGDDDPDIVIAHANSSLPSDAVVWINQGGAQAGEPGAFIAGASLQTHQVTSLLLGDVDSDGDRDVVVNAKNEDLAIGGQQIWLNNGLGDFTAGAVIEGPAHAGAVRQAGQFDAWVLLAVGRKQHRQRTGP